MKWRRLAILGMARSRTRDHALSARSAPRLRWWRWWCAALLLATLASVEARAQTPSFSENSVVYIVCTSTSGERSVGAGVIVGENGQVLTARHVAPMGAECQGAIGATTPLRPMLRRRVDPEFDGATLAFVRREGETFTPASYVSLTEAHKGQTVSAYGFPVGGTGEVSHRSGVISTVTPNSQGLIETDVLTARGMSGGPVVLQDGSLVGIVAGANFDPATGAPASYGVLSADVVATQLALPVAPQAHIQPASLELGALGTLQCASFVTPPPSNEAVRVEAIYFSDQCAPQSSERFVDLLVANYSSHPQILTHSNVRMSYTMWGMASQVIEGAAPVRWRTQLEAPLRINQADTNRLLAYATPAYPPLQIPAGSPDNPSVTAIRVRIYYAFEDGAMEFHPTPAWDIYYELELAGVGWSAPLIARSWKGAPFTGFGDLQPGSSFLEAH